VEPRSLGGRVVFGGVVLLLALARQLPAQCSADQPAWFSVDRSAALFAENDAFESSDSSYTNGIRATWNFMRWGCWQDQALRWLSLERLIEQVKGERSFSREPCEVRGGRDSRPCYFTSFGLGQTIYTPSTLFDTLPQPFDRPYAGLLFGTVGLNRLGRHFHGSTEIVFGVMGPWSGAEATQSLAHWTWSAASAKPRGWRNQLQNSVQVGVINTLAVRPPFPGEWCLKGCNGSYKEGRWLDLTLVGELPLTTYMRRVSAGAVARLGIGFPDVLTAARIPTTAGGSARAIERLWDLIEQHQPWFYGFYARESRHVWYNAFLEGTSADDDPGEWRDVSRISPRSSVGETSWGGAAGVGPLALTYTRARRSQEYTPGGGRHFFGALSLALTTELRIPGG
jgi:hypothetical protein